MVENASLLDKLHRVFNDLTCSRAVQPGVQGVHGPLSYCESGTEVQEVPGQAPCTCEPGTGATRLLAQT
jgi:hypothetical protein